MHRNITSSQATQLLPCQFQQLMQKDHGIRKPTDELRVPRKAHWHRHDRCWDHRSSQHQDMDVVHG